MKKLFLGILVIMSLATAACGVKSDLARPAGEGIYPRPYPVY